MAGGWLLLVLGLWAGVPEATGDLAQELQEVVESAPAVEVNTASASELQEVPLMTPDLVLRILQERSRRPFQNFTDFSRRIPLDPAQAFVFRRVLRFPARATRSRFRGYLWTRISRATSQGYRWTMRQGPALVAFKGPGFRWLLAWRGAWGRVWAGHVSPRFGLGLLDLEGPRPVDRLYRSQRWRWFTPVPGMGLEGRWNGQRIVLYATQSRFLARWEGALGVSVTRAGATLDGAVDHGNLRVEAEAGVVHGRPAAATRVRIALGPLRWTLRLDLRGAALVEGRLPLGPAARIWIRSRWEGDRQETRVAVAQRFSAHRIRWGLRSRKSVQDGETGMRGFIDLDARGMRVYAEHRLTPGPPGWLLFLERSGNLGNASWRLRWSVFRLYSWEGRLWLADPTPGFWPRVYALSAPGYRASAAGAVPLPAGWWVVARLSMGEDQVHGLSGELFVALRR